MYTSAALLDIHERGHRSFARLLDHCAGFSSEDFHRRIDGFGFSTLQRQLYHTIQAEDFWVSVLRENIDEVDQSDVYTTIESLQEYRAKVEAVTAAYLRRMSDAELSTVRTFAIDDTTEDFMPARVVLRTFSHIYHHQGQVLAMCRLLGRPRPDDNSLDVDFPIV